MQSYERRLLEPYLLCFTEGRHCLEYAFLNYNRGVTALEPCFVLAGTTKIDYAEDILLTENAKWIQVFSGRTGSDV